MLDSALQAVAERAPGFRGVAVVGMDGMPLARRAAPGGPDLDLCAAEYSALIRNLASMGSHEGSGGVRGMLTLLGRWNLLVERVTEEYFLLLVVTPEGSLGRSRYELRRAAVQIEPELR